jgi:hypothetical protein
MDETASKVGGPTQSTHYEVLGVTPDASQDRVHRAYVAMLAEFRANPITETEERVRRARIAYQVLSNPQSRALYNANLKPPQAPQRRWEKYYLQEEEESLMFWTGAVKLSIMGLLGFFWEYLLLRGLLWLPRALYRAIDALIVRKRPTDEVPEQPVDPQGGQG